MTCAIHTHGGLVVDAEVPPGCAAFFDREWVSPDRVTAVPAIVVAGTPVEQVAQASRALAGIAHDAVAAAGHGPVAVTGSGFIAEEARRRLAAEGRLAAVGEPSPVAIIETTGDPGAIVEATRRVRDLGRAVLVGEPLGRVYRVDVYPDLHARGLHLIARGRRGEVAPVATDLEAGIERGLQILAPGEPLDSAALWFGVMSSATSEPG